MTSSPFLTLKAARSPFSSRRPSPTARILPRLGFSFALSGRTIPLLVLLSASTRFTRILSPSGRSLGIVVSPCLCGWLVVTGYLLLAVVTGHLSFVTCHLRWTRG